MYVKFLCYVWFVFVLCFVCPMLPVSQDCQLLVAPSSFSNVYINCNVCTCSISFCLIRILTPATKRHFNDDRTLEKHRSVVSTLSQHYLMWFVNKKKTDVKLTFNRKILNSWRRKKRQCILVTHTYYPRVAVFQGKQQ